MSFWRCNIENSSNTAEFERKIFAWCLYRLQVLLSFLRLSALLYFIGGDGGREGGREREGREEWLVGNGGREKSFGELATNYFPLPNWRFICFSLVQSKTSPNTQASYAIHLLRFTAWEGKP